MCTVTKKVVYFVSNHNIFASVSELKKKNVSLKQLSFLKENTLLIKINDKVNYLFVISQKPRNSASR